MFYVVPAETTFADILAIKGFDHRGRYESPFTAITNADVLQKMEGRDYAVIEIRRIFTTETVEDADRQHENHKPNR